jgi:hypothetical protein
MGVFLSNSGWQQNAPNFPKKNGQAALRLAGRPYTHHSRLHINGIRGGGRAAAVVEDGDRGGVGAAGREGMVGAQIEAATRAPP